MKLTGTNLFVLDRIARREIVFEERRGRLCVEAIHASHVRRLVAAGASPRMAQSRKRASFGSPSTGEAADITHARLPLHHARQGGRRATRWNHDGESAGAVGQLALRAHQRVCDGGRRTRLRCRIAGDARGAAGPEHRGRALGWRPMGGVRVTDAGRPWPWPPRGTRLPDRKHRFGAHAHGARASRSPLSRTDAPARSPPCGVAPGVVACEPPAR